MSNSVYFKPYDGRGTGRLTLIDDSNSKWDPDANRAIVDGRRFGKSLCVYDSLSAGMAIFGEEPTELIINVSDDESQRMYKAKMLRRLANIKNISPSSESFEIIDQDDKIITKQGEKENICEFVRIKVA